MLIRLTGFNPTDPRNTDDIVELESTAITSIADAVTGDGYRYSTVTCNGIFFVKESPTQIAELVEEKNQS